MIEENYNTKYSIYDIIRLGIFDINGALGIMRKVFSEKALALAKLIGDSGVAFTPVIVNSINFYTTKKSQLMLVNSVNGILNVHTKPLRQSNLPFSTSQTFYDCSINSILFQTSYSYSKLYA